ncbi:MAG: radical SAM protein [Bacteroidales bacterium]
MASKKSYQINEIFYSLQGEGHHTGTAAVFVRFSGCNLRCSFCDTEHNSGELMNIEQIVAEVMKYPQAPMIVLTGGEPSLFIDKEFVTQLKSNTGKYIAIETNGTKPIPTCIDWVTLSPKDRYKGGNLQPLLLTTCNELKVVYTGQPLDDYFTIQATHYYLQPCGSNNPEADKEQTNLTIQAILKDPRWRLSLQTHKLLNIR